MIIRPADFRARGYTAGCQGCICLQSGRRSARRHTEVCRVRIEAELVKTPEGRLRMDRETLRRDVEFDKVIAEEDIYMATTRTSSTAVIDGPCTCACPCCGPMLRGLDGRFW